MIIEKVFAKLYGTYHYPFMKADERIGKMNEAERTAYYNEALSLTGNKAFVLEMQELIRTVYSELACKSVSKVEQNAYRLTLKSLQDFDKRIRTLANMYKPPNVNKPLNQL